MVDIAQKMREVRLRWYGQVIRRDEGEPVRHYGRNKSELWGGRHSREDEAEMVLTCKK